ncbi:InlB B-repeat-containing protein [Butyrivibrio sp. YAB3001]|uniref:InlB B-repeat-containing protein n=1 Tax=Butyrivibrio sp. YAB3001 TaxID=1520812 RepID=UPI0008F680E7|nr:hypothetical protein [Butyrivibrio sp. YAB3001]SFB69927.1 hypothetical protein SAMN02910398_00311 [Butyrivibrio sp. YAB3001]
MKNNLLLKLLSLLLTISLILTSITGFSIIRAFATDSEGGTEIEEENTSDNEENSDTNSVTESDSESYTEEIAIESDAIKVDSEAFETFEENSSSEDRPESMEMVDPDPPEYVPDPFDYDLSCYTPNINFGHIFTDDVTIPSQFTIVNTGYNAFPVTYELFDQSNGFNVYASDSNTDLEPGESLEYSVDVRPNLSPGTYKAKAVFFSANDYRRHHSVTVNFVVVVKAQQPYVDRVVITPGSTTAPTGKKIQFSATVSGGYDYNDAVTWSLSGHQSSGTSINNGVLTIASNESASSLAVIATSRQDPSVYDTAIVTITSENYLIQVSASPENGGAIAGGGSVKKGVSTTVSASPNNNFRFVGWYEGNNLLSSSHQLTLSDISSDRYLVAKFERTTCYVRTSVNTNDGGTVSESKSVAYGGNVTITAKAKPGYVFEGFVENNRTISDASTIQINNVTNDMNITAVFKRSRFNVSVSVYPQDTGKYEGAGTYDAGSNVRIKQTAYSGYEFAGWSINGQIVSTSSEYVIENIKNDVNIVANFIKEQAKTFKIVSGIANSGGSIVPSGDYFVQEGGSITYNMVPQAGYRVLAVAVDGKNIGAVASYTFNNVREKHSIAVAFELIPTPKQTQTPVAGKNNVSSAAGQSTKIEAKAADSAPYNEDTVTSGALPEQVIIEEEIPKEIETLDAEEYADDTYITSDEEVISSMSNDVATGSVLQRFGIDEDVVVNLIKDRAALPMLRQAFEDGTLQITVNNSYATDAQETSVALYHDKPTLMNFENVIIETLSDEEQLAVLKGTPVSFNVSITENGSTLDSDTKKDFQSVVGYKPLSYFDFLIMKTSNGTSTVIDKTGAELEVVIQVPAEYQKSGRKFCIIRSHHGKVDVLKNLDSSSNTITFRTDKFSEYAIAYEVVNTNTLILQFFAIAMITLILAIISIVLIVKARRGY